LARPRPLPPQPHFELVEFVQCVARVVCVEAGWRRGVLSNRVGVVVSYVSRRESFDLSSCVTCSPDPPGTRRWWVETAALVTGYEVTVECSALGFQFVTCGSAIKLANSDNNVRLHSHDVKYGSGSGQQVCAIGNHTLWKERGTW